MHNNLTRGHRLQKNRAFVCQPLLRITCLSAVRHGAIARAQVLNWQANDQRPQEPTHHLQSISDRKFRANIKNCLCIALVMLNQPACSPIVKETFNKASITIAKFRPFIFFSHKINKKAHRRVGAYVPLHHNFMFDFMFYTKRRILTLQFQIPEAIQAKHYLDEGTLLAFAMSLYVKIAIEISQQQHQRQQPRVCITHPLKWTVQGNVSGDSTTRTAVHGLLRRFKHVHLSNYIKAKVARSIRLVHFSTYQGQRYHHRSTRLIRNMKSTHITLVIYERW